MWRVRLNGYAIQSAKQIMTAPLTRVQIGVGMRDAQNANALSKTLIDFRELINFNCQQQQALGCVCIMHVHFGYAGWAAVRRLSAQGWLGVPT
jgi:hypothetical protein